MFERVKKKLLFLCCVMAIFLFYILPLKAEINNQTLAVLVNVNDPESIEIARYYQKARLIPESNLIYLSFPAGVSALTQNEFEKVKAQLDKKLTNNIQALALAWRKPWRVDCMSITSAFSLGFNKQYCAIGCKATKSVAYFNSQSHRPYHDYNIRPSMMLSAGSVNKVKELIDRGVEADYSRPLGTAYLLSTSDKNRNVRAVIYPEIKKRLGILFNTELIKADAIKNKHNIMFYFTGLKQVKWLAKNRFLPGAIADHLTSAGGVLFNGSQMSVLKWIDAGVTGTYGAVVEPCNFRQKFPNPAIVMQKYLSGSTLVEAYWKSVQMLGQGVFVGEPLAVPFKGCRVYANRLGFLQYAPTVVKNFVERKSSKCNIF